jgi:tetratricopeptide (TPR) repeat protein
MTFPTNEIMTSHISKMNPDSVSANDLYTAAVYYLNNDKDLQKAKAWITKAVELRTDAFWFFRQKALIHEALGELDLAIDAAKTSLQLATTSGNQQYIDFNKKQLAKWGAK